MARVRVASQPIAGHVWPLVPLVRELVARGHEVRWWTGRKYAATAQAAGATWEPWVHPRDYDDAHFDTHFPGRDRLSGLRQLRFDLRHIFVGSMEAQLLELKQLQRHWPADLVLADQTVVGALLHEELGGPPCALLGVLPLGVPSRDTAPFGLGLPPFPAWPGRDWAGLAWTGLGWTGLDWAGPLRNHLLSELTRHTVLAAVNRDLRELCRRAGVRERPFAPPIAPTLMLQPSVPRFEYPRRDLPPQLHFIGPLLPEPRPGLPLPAWWPEVLTTRRPVVVVTQGTLATEPSQLIRPTLRALAQEDVLVVAAGVKDPAALGPLPDNARVAAYLPFAELLPRAELLITNGGYGGVLQALRCGLPCVVAGTTEDKAEVAARVAYVGAGLNLRTSRPSPARLLGAVRRLRSDPAYREQAARLGQELRAHDAPREAADLLEAVLRAR